MYGSLGSPGTHLNVLIHFRFMVLSRIWFIPRTWHARVRLVHIRLLVPSLALIHFLCLVRLHIQMIHSLRLVRFSQLDSLILFWCALDETDSLHLLVLLRTMVHLLVLVLLKHVIH